MDREPIDLTGDDIPSPSSTSKKAAAVVDLDTKYSPSDQIIDVDADGSESDSDLEIISNPTIRSSSSSSVPSKSAFASTSARTSHDFAIAASLASGPQVLPSQKRKNRAPFSCEICLEDDIPSYNGYSIHACQHRFCIDQISSRTERLVDFTDPMSEAQMQQVTDTKRNPIRVSRDDWTLWEQYSETANIKKLEAECGDKDSDTRRCPHEHCNFIFQFQPGTGAEGTRFDCPLCNMQYCLQCGANNRKVGPAHPEMSCYDRLKQLEKEKEERKKFEQWKKENARADERFHELLQKEQKAGRTKPCSKCSAPITKHGGCSHMHCTSCKTHFSWENGSKKPKLMTGMNGRR
eukprot:CAMPEP_0113517034 /NCGR_PEP_ID=MMETSP0014_2-20120614/41965_1 /TAXON_ID=2857 /ORGANISM="Nitzschia sp." /LENGTH=348 /DNA_ID=CAMNT_0000414047 /DNA_START=34 /DNA_END=1081 /DNA_ORIENTATION=- /assembly_acc=CAM_ASM_000159